jgi:hypothetical protein
MKVNIGLDLDGVIIDNTKSKIKFAKRLGFDLKPEQTPADFIEKVLPAEVLSQLREFLYHDPKIALEAELVEGAVPALKILKKSDCRYFVISRRKFPELAVASLKKHKLWPQYFDFSNTFFVLKSEEKNIKAEELGIGVYIDDQPSVLEKLSAIPQRFLLDRFDVFESAPHYIKISSWQEFLSLITNN